MTFKIKMLTAVSVLGLPAVAAAQEQSGTPLPDTSQQMELPATTPPAQDEPNATESEQEAVPEPSTQTPVPTPPDSSATPPASSTMTPPASETPPVSETPPASTTPPVSETPPAGETPPASSTPPASTPPAEAGAVTQATAADVQAGAQVRDQSGSPVGTIESVSAQGAVISTGSVRAQIPITSFGKDGQGLVIAMTKAQLEAAAGQSTPTG